ncbi:MAG: non-ribosomal peptide synthetase [Nostoc sp. CmiVER01]|uniref:non-ribosomal peptide synthetase n=1 Tax=Nostoc sp. CmiVER01 TaxID=3075384 RepID=UPI002AD1F3D1|nr:non-ribosomal peptide synthetase [Nostoc sp. CmiVER01]MDZ8126163.1 amino acid adenylation domain-containing protein [Nostoc sp. CmiVER01]
MSLLPLNSQSILTAVDFDPFSGGELLLTAPATESQKEIWASVQMGDSANCAYNESQSLRLKGNLDVEAFQSAVQQLVQRHEALRTTFSTDGNTLCIVASLRIEIPIIDLAGLKPQEQETKIASILQQEVEQPFDLEHGPLFRAKIVKLHPQEHLAIMTAHHIICDGWSWAVLMPDVGKLYSGLQQGIVPELEEPDHFSEYAILQEEEAQSLEAIAIEQYWLDQFSDSVPVLDFPSDRPRPLFRTFNAAREDWHLNPELVANLKQLGTKLGCSFMTTILSGFEVWLHRLTGQDDLVVGISAAGQAALGQYNLVGHCVNLLPLRSRINGEKSFSDYLQTRRSAVLDAYDHQQFTFGSLIKKLVFPRDSSRIPLVPITFNIDQGLDGDSLPFAGLEVEFFSNPRAFENFELFINATELRGQLTLECQYNTNLFDADTIRRRMAEFETLLAGIVANPNQIIAKLPILPTTEQQLLAAWNNTQTAYPEDKSIHQLFETQVERTPDAIAVVFQNQQLTYLELDWRANQLAHYLQTLGVKPGVLVGICLERSTEIAIALLGVLKAGGAYVPLDPTYPKERLTFMLDDAQVSVLLTKANLLNLLPDNQVKVVCLDTDGEKIVYYPTHKPDYLANAENLAYVIYTSGSTGTPKGVKVSHQNVVNLLESMREQPGLTQQDILLSVTTLSFDIAVLEIFLPLIVGATTLIVSREVATDGEKLLKTLNHSRATIMQATPATWRLLLAAGWQGSKQLKILCGGEALPPTLAKELVNRAHSVWNMYGPTETTIWSTCYQIQADGIPLIGQPIANTEIYLLDAYQQLVPVGIPGELYIGGAGVALGYLNRPELTTERFISNPFSQEPHARLYRTGDLVRYRADGNLEYLQRIDNQLKIRGFRIELGEIETVMAQHPAVKEAVVVVREDIPDEKTLVGYLVPKIPSEVESLAESASSTQHIQAWNQRWDLLYESGLKNASPESLQDQTLGDAAIIKQLSNQDNFEEQVQEWLDQTVERILDLQPSRVMEIGCGTGQILLEIASKCTYYFGTDYAASALQELDKQLRISEKELPEIILDHRAADNFQGIEAASFDTVIIHSVVQYFPDINYLLQVLKNAVEVVKPGGCIYVGDVQSYGLLEAYHTAAQLKNSSSSMSVDKLRSIAENRVRNEDELVVDPDFFYALKQYIPAIGHVEIKLRRGHIWNETTQFHYDVFLSIEPEATTAIKPTWHDWLDENLTVADVQQILEKTQPDYYCIKKIPNARIHKEVQALALLKGDSQLQTVADVITVLEKLPGGIDPENLWALGKSLPYNVDLRWSNAAKDGYFEAVFTRISPKQAQTVVIDSQAENQVRPQSWSAYANSPMQKQAANNQLIPQLREFLKEKLPNYMVPATFMTLDAMPLTPNGKVDRKALPIPDFARPELAQNYVAPRTLVEQQIAGIWAQVLNLENIGIHDNFFELGGHSVLAIQVTSRLRQTFQVEIPLLNLFEVPTVADLAERVETLQWAAQNSQASQTETMSDYEEGQL